MKHIRNRWFLVWAVSLALVACKNDVPPIEIALQPNYQGVLEAISQSGQPLSEKVAFIEAAQRDGMADDLTAADLIRQAVASLSGTAEIKLYAIEEAVTSQATSLDTKLALIETAVSNGFAGGQTQMDLMQQAIASLGGSLSEKLAAVETAVKSQTTNLGTKIGLIEAAVQGGFADSADAQDLLQKAIASLGGTREEKQAAIEAAISNQSTALSPRMALIETAVKDGFADQSSQQALIKTALESMAGPADEKLAGIESAVTSRTTSLETKLALIEEAVENLGDRLEKLQFDLIRQAVSSLGGTLEEKLADIESAVGSNGSDLSTNLTVIETALTDGFADEETALGLVQTALGNLKQQLGSVGEGLSDAVDDVSTALGDLSKNVNVDMSTSLSAILTAAQGLPDYGAALDAIRQALVDLEAAIIPFKMTYTGEPTLTTANGGQWHATLQVIPANTVLSEEMLQLDIISEKQFFQTWGSNNPGSSSLSDFYSIKLAADSSVEGQYDVTISCRFPYAVWDEATVALSAVCGNSQNPKYVTTEPFNLVMMPKALSGLKYWTYPAASFRFKRHGSINNIYYSLDSGVFETQDQSETRTYSAEFVDSVQFLPENDSIAPVFIQLDKEKRMIAFIPDTAGITYTQFWPDKDPSDLGGRKIWRAFQDSSGVKHESLLGKLVLTDRWNVKDTIHNFKIGWYNAWNFPESAIIRLDNIQDDNTAVVDIRSLISKLGLERAWLNGRYILQEQYGDLNGPYLRMSAQLLPETLQLAVRFREDPMVGAKFGLTAHYDLWIFPTETDPQFKILALSFSYSLVVTIVN